MEADELSGIIKKKVMGGWGAVSECKASRESSLSNLAIGL